MMPGLCLDGIGHTKGEIDSAALYDNVDIVSRPPKETVPDKAADHEGAHPRLPCDFANKRKNRMHKELVVYLNGVTHIWQR